MYNNVGYKTYITATGLSCAPLLQQLTFLFHSSMRSCILSGSASGNRKEIEG